MEPVKSRDSKDRIDKRKVPGGDGNLKTTCLKNLVWSIDKRKVPGGDGNSALDKGLPLFNLIDKRKVPGGDGNFILFSLN